jgi:hypothetical protein
LAPSAKDVTVEEELVNTSVLQASASWDSAGGKARRWTIQGAILPENTLRSVMS